MDCNSGQPAYRASLFTSCKQKHHIPPRSYRNGAMPCAGIPFVIVNSLCGALVAYGLAGLRLTAHALIINLCITALQSMISIQLQVRCRLVSPCCSAGPHQSEPEHERCYSADHLTCLQFSNPTHDLQPMAG